MARTVPLLLIVLALVLPTALLGAQDRGVSGELVRNGALREATVSSGSEELSPPQGAETKAASTGSSPATQKPIPLAARKSSEEKSGTRTALTRPAESLITVGGSMCVVLSLFFGLAWLTRRGMPRGIGKLPGEVIEVLGKSPLVKGQELQLVRVGARLLLICVTPGGCETLTEITDDAEVDRLSAICRAHSSTSVTAAFNQVLSGVGREPAAGFAGDARTRSQRREGRIHA